MSSFSTFVLFVSIAACGDDSAAPLDAGRRDAGSSDGDSGIAADAGGSTDAGNDAAGPSDAGSDAMVVCPTAEALPPLLDGLFYTSESDQPLTAHFAVGRGDAVERADVVALREIVGATGAELSSIVDGSGFFGRVVIDPTRKPPIPETRPAELEAAFEAITESDRVAFEVYEEDGVTVRVHLLGRTRCGDAIWLASVAIRT
jgi:hypothetical protein